MRLNLGSVASFMTNSYKRVLLTGAGLWPRRVTLQLLICTMWLVGRHALIFCRTHVRAEGDSHVM